MGVILGQNLGQIRPNFVKKNKETGINNTFFFHILHEEYLLKQKLVVVQILEWNLRQILLEMSHSEDV